MNIAPALINKQGFADLIDILRKCRHAEFSDIQNGAGLFHRFWKLRRAISRSWNFLYLDNNYLSWKP